MLKPGAACGPETLPMNAKDLFVLNKWEGEFFFGGGEQGTREGRTKPGKNRGNCIKMLIW
jgi:hypothetical protein